MAAAARSAGRGDCAAGLRGRGRFRVGPLVVRRRIHAGPRARVRWVPRVGRLAGHRRVSSRTVATSSPPRTNSTASSTADRWVTCPSRPTVTPTACRLSVSHRGRWVLVDPGTYCYHRDELWRDHFRSTPAHNTVSVDGLSQSDMLGPFMWGRKARARQLAWATAPGFDYFEGAPRRISRRGTACGTGGPSLFGKRGYWLVVDHLEGRGRHRIDGTFQLAEGYDPAARGRADVRGGRRTRVEFRTWLPNRVGSRTCTSRGQRSPRAAGSPPGSD